MHRPNVAISGSTHRALRVMLALLVTFGFDSAFAEHPDPLLTHLQALTETLPDPAQSALDRIDGAQLKLLAARSYAKAGDRLASRWSWTAAQVREFERSAEHGKMLATVRAVTARFEEQNPGYSLYANMQVRTLELQLERWNSNPRVATVAAELHRSLVREVVRNEYPIQPTAASIDRFRGYLMRWAPSTPAPLAAPGLSAHGQLRAIDFQVTKEDRIVAGTSVASVFRIWEKEGWHTKLRHAVRSVGDQFVGPLRAPNEPWHYSYLP